MRPLTLFCLAAVFFALATPDAGPAARPMAVLGAVVIWGLILAGWGLLS